MILNSYVEKVMTIIMLCTRMVTLVFMLLEFSLFTSFLPDSCLLIVDYILKYFHDASRTCRTGHENVLCTGIKTLAFLLFELFPFDDFSFDFISPP